MDLAHAFAKDALGSGYMHDVQPDPSWISLSDEFVSLQELVELIGARRRIVRESLREMGAPLKRSRRIVIPLAWVRAHSAELFALRPKRKRKL